MTKLSLVKPLPPEVADQVQQAIGDARHAFAADVDALLTEIRAFVDQLPDDAFTRLSRYEAWVQLQRVVVEKFTQPTRSLEAAILRQQLGQATQLVREAHDALTNPETQIDLKDWAATAALFLER